MTSTERSTIAGVFINSAEAERAVYELQQAGFTDDQIRVSVRKGEEDILDGLIGMGFPQDEAQFYNQEYRAGRTVVAVKTTDRRQEAADILRLGGSGTYNRTDNGAVLGAEPIHKLQLREEVLQAEKQWVQTGEIRIRKRVITEERVFTVSVTREEVIIERVSFNGQSSDQAGATEAEPSASAFTNSVDTGAGELLKLEEGKPFTILVREEQVNIEKVPMVIEEITLTKKLVQETRSITDTAQREELQVEHTGNVHIQGNNLEQVLAE